MKTLLLMRHAKSDRAEQVCDHDRPLNPRGHHDAPQMGHLLLERGAVPDLILSSTAARAVTTAEMVAQAAGFGGELKPMDALYLADAEQLRDVARSIDDRFGRAMIVAHNPGMAEFLTAVTGVRERFPTATIARIEFAVNHWQDINRSGTVVNLWRPKELD